MRNPAALRPLRAPPSVAAAAGVERRPSIRGSISIANSVNLAPPISNVRRAPERDGPLAESWCQKSSIVQPSSATSRAASRYLAQLVPATRCVMLTRAGPGRSPLEHDRHEAGA